MKMLNTEYQRPDLLLFSGGLDSFALAKVLRPSMLLFVDYGQLPSAGERRAARVLASELDLILIERELDLKAFASGMLAGDEPAKIAPSPEWWPFRNQFLATAGCALAVLDGKKSVLLGSVEEDGERHSDGTAEFYLKLSAATSSQEGSINVVAPAVGLSSVALMRVAGLTEKEFAWSMSCHKAEFSCGDCPGCAKRQRVGTTLGFRGML